MVNRNFIFPFHAIVFLVFFYILVYFITTESLKKNFFCIETRESKLISEDFQEKNFYCYNKGFYLYYKNSVKKEKNGKNKSISIVILLKKDRHNVLLIFDTKDDRNLFEHKINFPNWFLIKLNI